MPNDHITSPVCAEDSCEPEVWRAIPDWPGYEASDLGRVRSYWTRTIKTGVGLRDEPSILVTEWNQPGAVQIILSRNFGKETRRAYVSHLVLEAFVGPRQPGRECCHFDGDNKNNRLDNLRWDTKSANMLDRLRHGTTKSHLLKEADIPAIWARLTAGERIGRVAKDYGVSYGVIYHVKMGNTWGHITRRLTEDPPFRLAYRP